ncbi:unnamed protein product [Lampetra fluviatilis]
MAQTPVSSAMPLRRPLGLSASKEKSARIRLLQLNFMKRLSAQAGTGMTSLLRQILWTLHIPHEFLGMGTNLRRPIGELDGNEIPS